ncbi:putative cytochrome b-c1 complex subunit Rieske, mitochondrial [Geopyxis carbonaria]|nr:putative cytochrome b-c1 complex subunit Rieske, mitochondrial [Geopyxis carbonaria]
MNWLRTTSRSVRSSGAARTITPRLPAISALRNSSTSATVDSTEKYSNDSREPKSPFIGADAHRTTKIPDFSKYRSTSGTRGNQVFGYFMVGTMGALTAAGAKATVQDFLQNMSASADVLAMAKVEVDLSAIPEGKNIIIKWRGKPVFIRHRTADEISEANNVKVESLRDPQNDADRVKKPEWLIMLGICTHLGCVPIGEAGDYGGWFCPCHGSHYDISGRIRRGPAPLNLEIPEYDFPEDGKLIIG